MVFDNQYLLNTIRFMLNRSIACIFLFFGVLVWTSGASASPFHHHEKKAHVLESATVQHACPLKHHEKVLPCPHVKSKKDNNERQIAPDCGGSSTASIPASVNFSKNLLFVSDSSLIVAEDQTDSFSLKSPRHKFFLPFQLDHPPKSL